jgi:hypothetical protein
MPGRKDAICCQRLTQLLLGWHMAMTPSKYADVHVWTRLESFSISRKEQFSQPLSGRAG